MSTGCTKAGDFMANPCDRVDLATAWAAPFNPKAEVAQNKGRRARAVTFMMGVGLRLLGVKRLTMNEPLLSIAPDWIGFG